MIGLAVVSAVAGAAIAEQRHGSIDPVVIGTGPHAVYVGAKGTFGGEPAAGETAASYLARTGRQLPGLSSATAVDEPWWYGFAPVFGGDPASGETAESYFARTGRHMPSRYSATVGPPTWNGGAPITGGDPVPGETDDSYFARTGRHLGG